MPTALRDGKREANVEPTNTPRKLTVQAGR